uniref:Rho-GAP domain-containing protein n=1 Tax=Globodera rostochiensis TaxID=31243 RepID=A0A914GZX4_GLORO
MLTLLFTSDWECHTKYLNVSKPAFQYSSESQQQKNESAIYNASTKSYQHQQKLQFAFIRPLSPPPLPPRPSLAGVERPLPLPPKMEHDNFVFHSSDKLIGEEKKKRQISKHSVLDMDSLPVTAVAPSYNLYASYCEPFDGYLKFDGESICFSGWVQLPQGMFKHRKRGWAIVRNNELSISQDDESSTPFFGPVKMSKCVFFGRSAAADSEIMFILRDLLKRGKSQKPLLSSNDFSIVRFTPEENHENWLSLLAKCCSPRTDLFKEELPLVDCCGRLWIKQGISGLWNEGWAFVHRRILSYWVQGPNALAEVDIRKVFLVKQSDIPLSDWCNYIEHSSSGPLLIALEGSSLYLQSEFDQCTSSWLTVLKAELKKVSNALEEYRLTPDNVPVIVDKCIGLVSTYGMFQAGIYRKNGSAGEVKRILQEFREDPYSVHLKPPITDETINAIADVLRTFFRQLNSPLIPIALHSELYGISQSLPEANTLKKLLGHLLEIVAHEDRNLASLDNISKVFGPTLFNVSNTDEQISLDLYSTATKQAIVTHDLIFYYCEIFGVDAEEILAKCKLDVIREQKPSKNPANGLLIPIHLFERDNKCFNVQSEWTAAQVVSFKIQKLAFVSPCESYALFEVVKNGQLERRIGANESLRSIVLGRWMDWVEEQQKDNFLLFKKDLHPFQPQSVRAFAEDLKLAEPGSRTFKSASLRIEDGVRVCQYSRGMKKQCQWKVDEMFWEREKGGPLQGKIPRILCGVQGRNTATSVAESSDSLHAGVFADADHSHLNLHFHYFVLSMPAIYIYCRRAFVIISPFDAFNSLHFHFHLHVMNELVPGSADAASPYTSVAVKDEFTLLCAISRVFNFLGIL